MATRTFRIACFALRSKTLPSLLLVLAVFFTLLPLLPSRALEMHSSAEGSVSGLKSFEEYSAYRTIDPEPPVLLETSEAGDGKISLGWRSDGNEPAQFLALAWDEYRGYWVERGQPKTIWNNFSPQSRGGVMDLGQTGAYHVWVGAHQWDESIYFCENPWTGIVTGGKPHRPIDVVAAEIEGLEISINWKPDDYGTWTYWFVAYDREENQWVQTQGPLGESLWHYVSFGSESFTKASISLRLPNANRHWILIGAMGWDAETLSKFTYVKSP